MDHNEFDFIDDLIQPFDQFLKECKIDLAPHINKNKVDGRKTGAFSGFEEDDDEEEEVHDGVFRFPEHLYLPPEGFPVQNSNVNLWNWFLTKLM